MKKLYACILVLLSTVCAFAQGDKKPSKGILIEPLKTMPYDVYYIKRPMVKVTLPLKYYHQYGSFERYIVIVHNGQGNENAIKILCRVLSELPSYYMETLDGFNTRDTVPPNTQAYVCTEDRSFATTVGRIVKNLPATLLGSSVVSVKKIRKRETGRFMVMLQVDTKNILRVVALLPDNVIKRQKRVQEAGVLSNTVIMHVDGYFSRATLTAHRPKYENGTMDIYYSLQNASDEDVEDGVITMRTALQNSFKGKQPTVSRYTFNWYHN